MCCWWLLLLYDSITDLCLNWFKKSSKIKWNWIKMEIIQMDVFCHIISCWYLCNWLPCMFVSALKCWITEKCGGKAQFLKNCLSFCFRLWEDIEMRWRLSWERWEMMHLSTHTNTPGLSQNFIHLSGSHVFFNFHPHYHFFHFWFKAYLCPVLSPHTYLFNLLISYCLVLQYLDPLQTDTKA